MNENNEPQSGETPLLDPSNESGREQPTSNPQQQPASNPAQMPAPVPQPAAPATNVVPPREETFFNNPQPNGGSFGPSNPVTPVGYAQEAYSRKKPASKTGLLVGAALLAGLLGGGVGAGVVNAFDDNTVNNSSVAPGVEINNSTKTAPTETLAQVAAKVAPSVVSIQVETRSATSSGSGVIINEDGTIITNNHVIDTGGANGRISVTLNDGTTAPAEVIGAYAASDLAVIKIDVDENLTPASFASEDTLHVGDSVLALGSPLGLEGSVTSGIISALGRTVNLGVEDNGTAVLLTDAIQTDAAVNPGNSGGPLVNMDGEIVGINSAIASLGASGESGSIGLGFAINADQVKEVTDQLIAGETPSRAVLGISVSDTSEGVIVANVVNGSAADGTLEVGDQILTIDGEEVTDGSVVAATVRSFDPGDKISLEIRRDGRNQTVEVTLGES